MVTILFTIALLLYIAASVLLVASYAGGRETAPRGAVVLVASGLVTHAAALVAFTSVHDGLPLVGLGPSLGTLAFLISLFLFVASPLTDSRPAGIVIMPLVSALLAIALAIGIAPSGQPLAFRGVWFSMHVVLAFIGYAGLAVAFAAGLLYVLQFRELKDKRLGRTYRFFPSLPALDTLGRLGVVIGFPALSIALVIAWAWTVRFRGTFAADDPQVIWGTLTWLTFLALLVTRRTDAGGSPRRAAVASVIGFVLVVASYVLLRLFVAGPVFL